MLNKGPHLCDAVAALDDILQRMQGHQIKKSAMLRKLKQLVDLPVTTPGTGVAKLIGRKLGYFSSSCSLA
ncbi:MAG TPA: hypothetical protein VGY99_18390 [Candidatus Binataceae bacterium]|jgi:hypothetical protein|nr:hypothetical protein [Candidatus Binataceae bacterium]